MEIRDGEDDSATARLIWHPLLAGLALALFATGSWLLLAIEVVLGVGCGRLAPRVTTTAADGVLALALTPPPVRCLA